MFIYTILGIVFLSTTFDSISYILASVVQTKVDGEPMRWNRLFWAGALSFLPVTLMLSVDGSLDTLQTASIIGSAPLVIISFLLCISIFKVAKYDLNRQQNTQGKVIDIGNFPEHDPWTDQGSWKD